MTQVCHIIAWSITKFLKPCSCSPYKSYHWSSFVIHVHRLGVADHGFNFTLVTNRLCCTGLHSNGMLYLNKCCTLGCTSWCFSRCSTWCLTYPRAWWCTWCRTCWCHTWCCTAQHRDALLLLGAITVH